MKKSINGTTKFWRVALRELYQLGVVDEPYFIHMYSNEVINKIDLNETENKIQMMVIDIIKNKEMFRQLIKEELAFISKGEVPDSKLRFKPMWLSYLLDCVESELMEENDFIELKAAINFDIPDWTPEETEYVNMVLDMVRITILSSNPAALDFFENPSFELLMHVNDMGDKWL